MRKISKITFNEKYWDNIFPDHTMWSKIYESRIKNQTVKKMADLHFKLLHRVLPSQENLFHWKISNSNRFGCTATEKYNHLFITCPKLNGAHLLIEQILKLPGIEVKLSLDNSDFLIFCYKITYSAYTQLNSHIFYTIFKFGVKNDNSINLQNWIFWELKYWQRILSHTS